MNSFIQWIHKLYEFTYIAVYQVDTYTNFQDD